MPKKIKVTDKTISAVFSQMAKKGAQKRKEKFLDPESPFYDPDYYKKMQRGEKLPR